jgi:hypothetical protein
MSGLLKQNVRPNKKVNPIAMISISEEEEEEED